MGIVAMTRKKHNKRKAKSSLCTEDMKKSNKRREAREGQRHLHSYREISGDGRQDVGRGRVELAEGHLSLSQKDNTHTHKGRSRQIKAQKETKKEKTKNRECEDKQLPS